MDFPQNTDHKFPQKKGLGAIWVQVREGMKLTLHFTLQNTEKKNSVTFSLSSQNRGYNVFKECTVFKALTT